MLGRGSALVGLARSILPSTTPSSVMPPAVIDVKLIRSDRHQRMKSGAAWGSYPDDSTPLRLNDRGVRSNPHLNRVAAVRVEDIAVVKAATACVAHAIPL